MASYLSREEAVAVVERLIRRVYPDREVEAWIELVERSLGVPQGKVRALLAFEDELGAEEIVAAALGELDRPD